MEGAQDRPRIAIVDDDEALALLLAYNIEATGLKADWISNGLDVMARVSSRPPRAIVLDWMLPGQSGLVVLRQLRSCPLTRAIPVLMLTARNEDGDRQQAAGAGADDYLTKPFSIRDLMIKILRMASWQGTPPCAEAVTASSSGATI